ncbi:MAG: HD domain-containing phosphohydrolase [Nostocoides sp.]
MVSTSGDSAPPQRADLLGALSLAIDLGLGLPAEHVMRSALTGYRLASVIGLAEDARRAAFHTTMVMWIGCHADSHEYAQWFGDDIRARHDSYAVDWAGLPYAGYLARHLGHGEPLSDRLRTAGTLLTGPRGHFGRLTGSHCTSAGLLARRLDLGADVEAALPCAYERWDGRGLPRGVSGTDLPVAIRIAQLCDVAEARREAAGVDAALAVARERAGGQFDPDLATAFAGAHDEVLLDDSVDVWAEARRVASSGPLSAPHLDALVTALGDFVDLKSPYTLGHSAGVAGLAAAAARHTGMVPEQVGTVRRAGHLHDLGRIGVSNQVWDKVGLLTAVDVERVRMHPYLTGRILQHVGGLDAEAEIAANHHERLDGSGYPRGVSGNRLTLADQILAAADTFHAALEPRPHRAAIDRQAAADLLGREVRAGRLGGDGVAAVLTAAGERRGVRDAWPDGLTAREVQVLRLVTRARTTGQIAGDLGISVKTVRNHLDHVYAKTATRNRVGASLYAMEHGLADPPDA